MLRQAWSKELRRPRTHLGDSRFYSPLCADGSTKDVERARKNAALWKEKDSFASRLRVRRRDRELIESAAAVKIQGLCRGIVVRNRVREESRLSLARQRLRKSYKKVRHQLLVKRTVQANVHAARGKASEAVVVVQKYWRRWLAQRCAAKERRTRQEEVLNWAATRLQSLVRKRFAWRSTSKHRMRYYEARRAQGSCVIQSLMRKASARKKVVRRKALLEYVAATMVQRCARWHLGRKAFAKKKEMKEILRVNTAAIPIQAIFRGQLSRRFVRALRRQEKKDLIFAAALNLQRVFRGHLGRQNCRQQRTRIHTENTVAACILVQRALKGHLARMAVNEERAALEANLFAQARAGNVRAVEDILGGLTVGGDQEYDLTSTDDVGMTALHVAVRWGHLKLVKKLVSMGIDINAVTHAGEGALLFALRHSRVISGNVVANSDGNGIAEYLIAKGIHLNTEGRTMLHEACVYQCKEPIRFLLQMGIALDVQDLHGLTPLHECAQHGHANCTKLLLERNANVNVLDNDHVTPLHLAASRGHLGVVELLVESGRADLSLQDRDGRTAWRRALVGGNTKVAHFLQASWSDMIERNGHEGHHGTDPLSNSIGRQEHADAAAAAVAAARLGDMDSVNDLIQIGSVDAVDPATGDTILIAAASCGARDIMDLCVSRGCKMDAKNFLGQTALHAAVKHGNLELFEYLVQMGCKIARSDNNNSSVAHMVVTAGVGDAGKGTSAQVLRREANHGFDPQFLEKIFEVASAEGPATVAAICTKDNQGNTPLHLASQAGFKAAVTLLLKRRLCDPVEINGDGKTAVQLSADETVAALFITS